MNHPLRNFQRGPTWSSNNDPLVARNRIMDDLQFLPGIRMKSIVDRDSGTIGILECCSTMSARRHEQQTRTSDSGHGVLAVWLPLCGDDGVETDGGGILVVVEGDTAIPGVSGPQRGACPGWLPMLLLAEA